MVDTANSTEIPVDQKSGKEVSAISANWWRCWLMAFGIESGYIEKSLSIYEDPMKTSGLLDRIFFGVSSIGDSPRKLGPERVSETKKTWLTNWKLLIFMERFLKY